MGERAPRDGSKSEPVRSVGDNGAGRGALSPTPQQRTPRDAAGSPQSSSHSSHVDLRYAQYAYDNLTFADVIARTEYGSSMLESVAEMLKVAAVGEDTYSKSLADAARIATSKPRGTGQGIGLTVDGAAQKQSSLLGAGLQALGGFFGSGSGGQKPGGSAGYGGDNGMSTSSGEDGEGIGNGSSSLGSALAALARSQMQQAQQRQALAGHLRKLHVNLMGLREHQRVAIAGLLGKAGDAIRATQAIARDLDRGQARVDKARRDLEEADNRFNAARSSGGAVPEQELQRRHARLLQCRNELQASQESVLAIGEALVSGRRRRDDDLTGIARQLQRLDEERLAALARTMADLAGSAADTAGAARVTAMQLSDALQSVCVESDIRMFTHQRRIALMLAEQISLQDARSGRGGTGGGAGAQALQSPSSSSSSPSGIGEDEAQCVPQPVPVSVSMRHHRDFIAAEKALSPVVHRWVVESILTGKGHEVMHGARLPDLRVQIGQLAPVQDGSTTTPAVASSSSESTTDGSSDAGGGSKPAVDASPASSTSEPEPRVETVAAAAAVPDDDDDESFDVDMLDHHAARIAFLRSLNQQRSKKQDVSPAFHRLARVMWWLLDACESHQDICCARMVMVMAETFYQCQPAVDDTAAGASDAVSTGSSKPPTKQFLQALLKHHPLWRSSSFWEETYYTSVFDAVRASTAAAANSNGGGNGGVSGQRSSAASDAYHADDASSSSSAVSSLPAYRPGSKDWGYSYTQTLFSNLAAVAMNMITFGMHPDHVVRTVTSLARGNGLPAEMIQALHATVKTYAVQG